jgi:hypothetical protein
MSQIINLIPQLFSNQITHDITVGLGAVAAIAAIFKKCIVDPQKKKAELNHLQECMRGYDQLVKNAEIEAKNEISLAARDHDTSTLIEKLSTYNLLLTNEDINTYLQHAITNKKLDVIQYILKRYKDTPGILIPQLVKQGNSALGIFQRLFRL